MHDDPTYLNLEDRIPLYVAANGPKALGVVGRLGDGWITAGGLIPSIVSQQFAQITLAARVVGRTLPSDFLACNNVTACVLRRGEKLTSDRVIQLAGPIVTTNLHFAFEVWEQSGRNNELIPPFLRNIWDEFVVHVNEHGSPQAPRFQKLHAKHGTSLQAEERRFVTRETIQGSCLVGEPDEMVAQIGELQRAGLTELSLMPPAGSEYEVLRDFSRLIMPHFKDAP
jgi:alkanesulfonate monooxygenase SsuD/methylene tetrahydromethanopterin reductase-like flavin-dependent oxidoreductase (luciferase family)